MSEYGFHTSLNQKKNIEIKELESTICLLNLFSFISGLETLQRLEILDLADNQVQMQQPNLIIEFFVDGTIFYLPLVVGKVCNISHHIH
jgi:hypothetical protein